MAERFASAVVALLLLSCSSAPTSQSPVDLPAWVSYPTPHAGQLTAIGIVAARPTLQMTLDDACIAAGVLLERSFTAHVVSVSEAKAWELGHWGRSDTVVVSPARGGTPATETSHLATWMDPGTGEGYCLVGTQVEEATDPCLNMGRVSQTSEAGMDVPPGWVDSPPKSKGALTAVGYAQGSAYTGNLLEGSIRDAMGGLARILGDRVSGVLAQVRGSGSGGPVEERIQSAEAWLQGARMVAWWRDRSRGGAYALVCMPTAGVKLQLAAQLTKEAPAEDAATRAEGRHLEMSRNLKTLLDASL